MGAIAVVRIHHLMIIAVLISSQCKHALCADEAQGNDRRLFEFKSSITRTNTTRLNDWTMSDDVCEWTGVKCDDDNVIKALIMENFGLTGNGSRMDVAALAKIGTIQRFSLAYNGFTGSIPAFNLLTSLTSLDLYFNNFTGEIPDNFFENMTSLVNVSFAANFFTGRIPSSLGKLNRLERLILSDNHFSGPVPVLPQQSLRVFNVSFNYLEGEVPKIMERFGPNSYTENTNALCGNFLYNPCKAPPPAIAPEAPPPQPIIKERRSGGKPNGSAKWVVLAIVLALLLASWILKDPNEGTRLVYRNPIKENFYLYHDDDDDDDDEEEEEEEDDDEVMQLERWNKFDDVDDGLGHHSSETHSISSNGSCVENLVFVNESKGVFNFADLMTGQAEILGNDGLGSTYKSILADGTSVVVKRLRDVNKLNRVEFGEEVMRFGMIRHPNVLPPLAYLYQYSEEKLLLNQFIPGGSLFSVLHGNFAMPYNDPLNWPQRLKIIKGVARGMGFLHTQFPDYQLPHGNLKSSNVLLSENYEPLLSDYGLFQLIGNTHSVVRTLTALKCPEVAAHQKISPKCDVYCFGVLLIEIMTGEVPLQYVQSGEEQGGTDVVRWLLQALSRARVTDIIDPEISNTVESLESMEDLMFIAAACVEEDPAKRLAMKEVIRRIDEIELEA